MLEYLLSSIEVGQPSFTGLSTHGKADLLWWTDSSPGPIGNWGTLSRASHSDCWIRSELAFGVGEQVSEPAAGFSSAQLKSMMLLRL